MSLKDVWTAHSMILSGRSDAAVLSATQLDLSALRTIRLISSTVAKLRRGPETRVAPRSTDRQSWGRPPSSAHNATTRRPGAAEPPLALGPANSVFADPRGPADGRLRVLFTTWEGGGHVPAALIVARKLRELGVDVRLVSDEATRRAAQDAGIPFEPWRTAPNRIEAGVAADPVKDWRAQTPFGAVKAVCDGVIAKPAGRYAADVIGQVESFRPHVIVSNELLFGALIAGEKTGVPVVLLSGNLWPFPNRVDLPPFGTAWSPAKDAAGLERDAITRRIISRIFDQGLPDLNAARAMLGLPRLNRLLEQVDAASLCIVGTARAFDYACDPPPGVAYAGPLISVPHWAGGAEAELQPSTKGLPLVLVSFSTIFQNQQGVVARCIRALSTLPVEAVVTCGPAIDPSRLPQAPNVKIVESASHDDLVPRCAAVICHAGHGTALRPLMHGVPVLCIPSGRDQPDNAARIATAGAGLRLSSRASTKKIARSVSRLLTEPAFRQRAAAWGHKIRAEVDDGLSAAAAIRHLAVSQDRSVDQAA